MKQSDRHGDGQVFKKGRISNFKCLSYKIFDFWMNKYKSVVLGVSCFGLRNDLQLFFVQELQMKLRSLQHILLSNKLSCSFILRSLEEAVPCIPAADLWRSGLRSTWLWRCCSSQLCGLHWELPPVLREGEKKYRLWSQLSWWPNCVFTISRDRPEAQKQSVKLRLNPWEMTRLTITIWAICHLGKYRIYIYIYIYVCVFPFKLAESAQLEVSWLGRWRCVEAISLCLWHLPTKLVKTIPWCPAEVKTQLLTCADDRWDRGPLIQSYSNYWQNRAE